MLTSFGSGEIWKGSNQEISVVLVPRCYKVEGEITDVVINFYTTAGGTSIEFSGDTVTVSGINATVVFQPVQLDILDDGLIRYNVAFNEGGESHVFDLETRYMLKTPNDYEPVDYVTHAEVEGVVDELLDEKLEDYYTKEQTDSAITAAIEAQSGTTSAQTQEMITEAMAAETARTEQTYLKEHQSLADYYTSAQTDSAIETAMAAETARTEQTYLKEYNLPAATTTTLGGIKVGSGLTIDSGGTLSTDIKEIHFVVVTTGDTRQAAIYEEIRSAITNNYFDASKYRFYASFKYESYNEYTEQEIKLYAWEKSGAGRIWFNLLIGDNQSTRDLQLYSKKWYLHSNGDFYETSAIKKKLQFELTAGTGIEITDDNTINCTVTGGTVPVATTGSTGVVKVGSGLTVDSAGTLANTDITYNLSEMTDEERAAAQAFMSANRTAYNYHIMYHIDGDPGWIYSTQYSFDGNSGAIYLTFIGRENKKYLYFWTGSSVSKLSEDTFITSLPIATTGNTGMVQVGSGLTVDENGVLSATSAETQQLIEQAMAAETARTEQTYLKEHQSLANYYTSAQTDTAISNAIAAETARTEQTYLKEHQSLADYYTSAQTNSAIETAIETQSATTSAQTEELITEAMAQETARTESTYLKEHQSLEDYYTSAQTNSAIETAMAAETARTEQTYLKEHQSLADYYTSAQTDSAITTSIQTAMTDVVTSTTIDTIVTCTQAQYDSMTAHTNNILYFING